MLFSIIVPVYNRPDEIDELLQSIVQSKYTKPFEIVIVEDGSSVPCNLVIEKYKSQLQISYYFKKNSGPGDSRNFGMKKAKGDYFIIFDSDCIIPDNYLNEVEKELDANFVDCFGGPDKALKSFSNIQKAINFSMTSFLTTGGIRGGSEKITKFQPRSFNMGISKKAFEASNGFGNIHPGEDPDLSIRLWKLGFKTRLFSKSFVYHKRRIDWEKFSLQVSKFGKARPILNHWYPEHSKLTFWFPTMFCLGFIFSIFSLFFLFDFPFFDWPIKGYFVYFLLIFIVSSIQNKNIIIGFYSIIATWKQFFGYGFGFLNSFFKINILKQEPKVAFPNLFFTKQKIVGLTGGIGSGKTSIANYILSKGIPIYVSDVEAKKVMENQAVSDEIINLFGQEIVENNKVNREKLAKIVFQNPEKLKQLNAIVHPKVKEHFENWVEIHKNNSILIKEAAILFESGSYKDCDFIITVTAPIEERISRVISRDNCTREQVLQRIGNQISDEERIAKSQFIINNSNFEQAKAETDIILQKLQAI